ncbi:MAG: DEAD/DEAH box helicase family protein [Oscillospiraceae bacterium]|nr:DEAD/DEAH box helicase family protein [Oscillospiraceae bacterium]
MSEKEYAVSFYGEKYRKKPEGKEVAMISRGLKPNKLSYSFLARQVGESGCTFAPALFNGSRKSENFAGMQIFAIDIDEGASFVQIKDRADLYRIPILFAYRSFSWTSEHEKFRVVFAADRFITDVSRAKEIMLILMKIFEECDAHCSDVARMFFGSTKGLLYLAEQPVEFTMNDLTIALNCYMYDRYGESHYTAHLRKFYDSAGVEIRKKVPIHAVCQESDGRRRTSHIDFNVLKERCQLYRDFVEGKEYYYYKELFLIATNLINADKGKNKFLQIINSPVNSHCEAYHTRSWKMILNTLIDMNYHPQSCQQCPHESSCPHYKNMLLTVDAGKYGIRPIYKKEYVSVHDAEESLADNFRQAVEGDTYGIKLIIAQTGLGKTNTYLHYLKSTDKKFIIAAPTHKLISELYEKALALGVTDIFCFPEFPQISDKLIAQIEKIYRIGAGRIGLQHIRSIANKLEKDDPDRFKIEEYLEKLDAAYGFEGHLLMTHQRFLYLRDTSPLLMGRTVIIDEDILSTAFPTVTVQIDDIKRAMKMDYFDETAKIRIKRILTGPTYQRHHHNASPHLLEDDLAELIDGIQTNVLDLLNARVLIKNDDDITYIKSTWLPTNNITIMSATANPDLYKWLFPYTTITTYRCKQAKYLGRVLQYTDSSYSRKKLTGSEESTQLIANIKQIIDIQPVITFKCCTEIFQTEYHYGAIEGLNVLEGKDIAVVGLPNTHETVYKLYGMLMGVEPEKDTWRYKRIEYNGYEFYLNTFTNHKLRTVQLWMIESNLEQAVGRARLLRYPCTVLVFARFPIDQAEIV